MIKTFLTKNTNFNEIDVNFIIENLNENFKKINDDYKKCDYVEKIIKIDMFLYFDKNECENNIYINYDIEYFNFYQKRVMHENKYFLIDCEHDVCNIHDYLIFERYINLMIKTKSCEICKIENINIKYFLRQMYVKQIVVSFAND